MIEMKPKSLQVSQKEDIRKNYPKENVYFTDSSVLPDSLKENIRKKFGNNSKIGKVVVHPGLPQEKADGVKKIFAETGIEIH